MRRVGRRRASGGDAGTRGVYNFYAPDPSLKERAAAEARAALGDTAFEELREQGCTATFEEAVRLGAGTTDDPAGTS